MVFFWLWLGKLRLTAINTLAREHNNAVANRRTISYNPSLLMCHIISASPFHSVRIKLHLHNWLCRRIKAESRVLGFGMEILVSGSMTLSPTWNMISYDLKVSEYPWEERVGGGDDQVSKDVIAGFLGAVGWRLSQGPCCNISLGKRLGR